MDLIEIANKYKLDIDELTKTFQRGIAQEKKQYKSSVSDRSDLHSISVKNKLIENKVFSNLMENPNFY